MRLASILAAVRPLTMVCDAGVAFTVDQALGAIEAGRPGVLVECGAWKGGCAIAMLLAQRQAFGRVRRPVHFLDGFAGLPAAEPRDGAAALAWQAARAAPGFHDNCRASHAELVEALQRFGFVAGEYVIWPGPFDDTLPDLVAVLEAIALLRVDCDWYASVRPCLDHLVPLVSVGATVILDDYYAWDGCARAVHDYLADVDQPYRIRGLPDGSAAYFVKA